MCIRIHQRSVYMKYNFTPERLGMEDIAAANSSGNEVGYSDSNVILSFQFSLICNKQVRIAPNLCIFMLCEKGTLHITLNGVHEVLQYDKVALCWPGSVLHVGSASPDFAGGLLCISTQFLQAIIHRGKGMWERFLYLKEHPVLRMHPESSERFAPYEQLIANLLKNPNRAYYKEVVTCAISGMLYELFADLPEAIFHKMEQNTLRQGDILFRKFTKLLTDETIKSRHVSSYADKLCITPKYLSAVCTKVSGRTASEWINDTVIDRIRYQLAYTDKSIKEISEYSEFPNMSFFCKYVRKALGCSPKAYRDKLR